MKTIDYVSRIFSDETVEGRQKEVDSENRSTVIMFSLRSALNDVAVSKSREISVMYSLNGSFSRSVAGRYSEGVRYLWCLLCCVVEVSISGGRSAVSGRYTPQVLVICCAVIFWGFSYFRGY